MTIPTIPDVTTDWKTVRSAEQTISSNNEDWYINRVRDFWGTWHDNGDKPYDEVSFNNFTTTTAGVPTNIDFNALKRKGYKSVSFYITLNVTEIDDGWQHIGIFKSTTKSNDQMVSSDIIFSHGDRQDTSWWVHSLNIENIPTEKFEDNFVVRYRASGDNDDYWKNKDLKIRLVFRE